jgi:hypothetical protein
VSPARAATIAILCGLLTFGLCYWPMGISGLWSVVLAALVAAVVLPAGLLSGVADMEWAAVPQPLDGASELQASMLSARLNEAAGDPHRFVTRVRPRLQRMALDTLRRRPALAGLSTLDDPRARAALGEELHTLLTASTARLPAPNRLAAMLRRLEES